MAAPTAIVSRIDEYLDALVAEVDDLPNVHAEWGNLADAAQASVALDWDHLMASYMCELDKHYRSGNMISEQQARYADLLQKLDDALPIIERLNFMRPTVSPKTLKSA